jgi:N-acetylglucosamine kinase-like BadF-type ATPase
MTQFFLGADLGGTKTHFMIADETGRVIGFGEGGPGNHEVLGYDVMRESMQHASRIAFSSAGIEPSMIAGAGFGIAGYDWPKQKEPILKVIETLKLGGKLEMVNDTVLGILAGSPRLWGIAVVSGTGCNCWGWDQTRTRIGHVTGGGVDFGEFAGASELIFKTKSALAKSWTLAGPPTALADAFCRRYNVDTLEELLQGILCRDFDLDPADAPLVFEVARAGDPVAIDIIRWAGRELAELAGAVIRQLHFEQEEFDLVQIGSMFDGSPILMEEMKRIILTQAPGANFVRLKEHPVLGAVLLGMESVDYPITAEVRSTLIRTTPIRQPNR